MLKKGVILVFVLFFASQYVSGAPTISEMQGSLNNGNSVSIQGEGFGIKDPVEPYKYDSFDDGAIGQEIIPLDSDLVRWGGFSSCAANGIEVIGDGFQYSSTYERFQGDIVGWKFFGYNSNYDCYQGTNYLSIDKDGGFDNVYWSMWLLSETNDQDEKVRNVKIANWNNAEVGMPQGRWDLYPMNNPTSGHVYALGCNESSNQWGVGAETFSYGDAIWNRFGGMLKVGDIGVNNGEYAVYKNGQLVRTTGNVMIRNNESCAIPDTFYFTHYHDDIDTVYDPPIPEENLYHSEIYFDITLARIELCDSPVWSDDLVRHCEIQIPQKIWNGSIINFTLNLGSFTQEDIDNGLYLFVVDENGEVSNGFLIGGSQNCNIDSDCDDGNPCTQDMCINRECVYPTTPTYSCNDGISCTSNDFCLIDGKCSSVTTLDSVCPDDPNCDVKSCTQGGCLYFNCNIIGEEYYKEFIGFSPKSSEVFYSPSFSSEDLTFEDLFYVF